MWEEEKGEIIIRNPDTILEKESKHRMVETCIRGQPGTNFKAVRKAEGENSVKTVT